jgi:hypothetical protein
VTIQLTDAAQWFRGEPHQIAAWERLQQQVPMTALSDFEKAYRSAASTPNLDNPLAAPYFPQLDNGPEGWRQCQTSSIAMALAFLGIPGIRDDLDYLRIVQRYGDTTAQEAHRQALVSMKVKARFSQRLSTAEVVNQIRAGRPVAIGVLHHGPVSAPSGGGHYILVIGFTGTHWICHDPFGELNLVAGGWTRQGHGGKGVRYSFQNLNPRWLVEGPESGWGWVFG